MVRAIHHPFTDLRLWPLTRVLVWISLNQSEMQAHVVGSLHGKRQDPILSLVFRVVEPATGSKYVCHKLAESTTQFEQAISVVDKQDSFEFRMFPESTQFTSPKHSSPFVRLSLLMVPFVGSSSIRSGTAFR